MFQVLLNLFIALALSFSFTGCATASSIQATQVTVADTNGYYSNPKNLENVLKQIATKTATWGQIGGNINLQSDLQAQFATKQNTLTLGNLTATGLTVTGGSSAIVGSGLTLTPKLSGNLQVNGGNIDTIQNIQTGSSPTFAGLTVGSSTGIVKVTSGTVGVATAGTDYQGVTTFSYPFINISNTITLGITGNLQLTGNNLDTIQNITTASSPTFAGLTVGSLSGVLKATGGVLSGSSILNNLGSPTSSFSFNSQNLTNLLDPVNPQDAATKNYVDSTASGLSPKTAVQEATTTTLPTNTYNNGASGVGATLTATSNGALTVDSTAVALNDRVLVKNEATQANNGIYTETTLGDGSHAYVLTRATDSNTGAGIKNGLVFISSGSTQANQTWVNNNASTPTIGSTAITYVIFSSTPALTFTSPLTKVSSTVSINNALADGSTKGAASFNASDFSASSGNISFNYTGSQKATTSQPGILTSGDWNTFNGKQASLGNINGIVKGNGAGSYSSATVGTDYQGVTTFSFPFINTANTITLGITSNLKLTTNNLDTVQAIQTSSSPTFAGITVGGSSGMLKAVAGVWTIATAGTDYQAPISLPLSMANGGTNASLTANNGGIVYSNASTLSVLAGVSTAQHLLMSGASTTPAWSVATYPTNPGSSGAIIQSNGTNFIASAATFPTSATNNSVIIGNGTNFVVVSVPNCTSGALQFTTATNLFSCGSGGTGTPGGSTGEWQMNNSGVFGSVTSSSFSNTFNQSSGTSVNAGLAPTINQSGTAGYTVLDINPTETATGSGGKYLINLRVGGTQKAYINDAGTIAGTVYQNIGTTVGSIQLNELPANGATYVGFQAPATVTSSVLWTLPQADSSGCFQSNGSGTVTIGACGSGSGTINSGTGGQLTWYASNGTTLSGITDITYSATRNASSGTTVALSLTPTWTETSTAGYTGLLINATETSVGSGNKLLLDLQIAGTDKAKIDDVGNETLAGSVTTGGTGQSTIGYGVVVNNGGNTTTNGGDFSFKNSSGTTIFSIGATSGNTTLGAMNFILDTTTGTKIGTATTQKLGFFNATPIVQPTGNICTAMTNLGLVASCTETGGSGMTYPTGTGIAVVTSGTSWGTTLTAPSGTIVGTSDTQTLTNKRITLRSVSTTQSATPSINTDNTDIAVITGLAQAVTSFTTNLTGTPTAGDQLEIEITDNATARAITWGAKFVSSTVTLPSTTVISTQLRVFFQWDAVNSVWVCIGVA